MKKTSYIPIFDALGLLFVLLLYLLEHPDTAF